MDTVLAVAITGTGVWLRPGARATRINASYAGLTYQCADDQDPGEVAVTGVRTHTKGGVRPGIELVAEVDMEGDKTLFIYRCNMPVDEMLDGLVCVRNSEVPEMLGWVTDLHVLLSLLVAALPWPGQ